MTLGMADDTSVCLDVALKPCGALQRSVMHVLRMVMWAEEYAQLLHALYAHPGRW